MNIEKELESLLIPTKVGSMIDNTSISYTPVCADTLGDGALLAEVMPINSRPHVWYIRIDSTYLYMGEDEQNVYEDEIHQQIESDYGKKWLTDYDRQDEEEMEHWTEQEQEDGFKDYPAYEWDGGSIEILNIEPFIYNFFKEWLPVSGFSCEEAVDRFNESFLLFKKKGVEVSLYPEYIEVDSEDSRWERFTYSSETIVAVIEHIKRTLGNESIDPLLTKDSDKDFKEDFTAETFKYPYFYYQYGKNTNYIYHCFDIEERKYAAIPLSKKQEKELNDCKNYSDFYTAFLALLNAKELVLIFTNYYGDIKDLSSIETKKLIPYL